MNNLSWLLSQVHGTDESLLFESIQLVEKALQQKEAPFIWDTTAEAYWKTGKTDAALNAAKNALELAKKVGTLLQGGIKYYLNQLDKFSVTTK